jgi:hypothetical protein
MTPKTRADGQGVIDNYGRVRGQAVLCFVHALVKCTRIYFSGANDAPCFLAHSKQRSWMLCSVLQLSLVVLPKARAFTSSTKPIPEDGEVGRLQASTRLAL